MADLIGVVDSQVYSGPQGFTLGPLKRQILLFDRLAIPFLKAAILDNPTWCDIHAITVDEARWLYEQGIIFEPTLDYLDQPVSIEAESHFIGMLEHSAHAIGPILGHDQASVLPIDLSRFEISPTQDQINAGIDEFIRVMISDPESTAKFSRNRPATR